MAARQYTQRARAQSTEETRRSLITATIEIFHETGDPEPPLDAVAARAGTTKRTLLRHFVSKDGLIEAAIETEQSRIMAQRASAPGDIAGAIAALVDHYEADGDNALALLAHAERGGASRRAAEGGIALHAQWVRDCFAPVLTGLPKVKAEARFAAVATVTDVYTWQLLRRRHGLSRRRTEQIIRQLTERALET